MGHPDGQNFPIWQGSAISTGLHNVVSGTPVVNQWTTVNFASAYILVGPLSAGVTAVLAFFADAAFTQQIILKAWIIRSGNSVSVITPALGPYARLNVNTAQAGTIATGIVIVPVNTPVPGDVYPDSGNTVRDPLNLATPNQVVDYFFPFVSEGEGLLVFTPTDATGKLSIAVNEVNEAGTIDGIAYTNPGPVASTGPIFFKSSRQQMKVTITNNDGAANHGYSVWASLIGKT